MGGRHAVRRREIIRAHQLTDLQRKRVQIGDAVKVLDRSHEFCGFTGRILHVDTKDPNRELAEVSLSMGTMSSRAHAMPSLEFFSEYHCCMPVFNVDFIRLRRDVSYKGRFGG